MCIRDSFTDWPATLDRLAEFSAKALLPGRGAGLIAAALLNATLLLGAGAVTMTPDTPLLFFWVCALWALARLHTCGANGVGGAENGGGAEGARAAECGGRAEGLSLIHI